MALTEPPDAVLDRPSNWAKWSLGLVGPARRYQAPPIVEAVFECVFSDSLSEQQCRKVIGKLKRNYAVEAQQNHINTHVDLGKRETRFEEIEGARLASDDQTDVVIVVPQTITWAKLAPYTGGDAFIERIMRDFEIAKAASGVRKLSRLGLRYINRIDVPRNGDVVPYEDYIAINLSLPAELDPVNSYGWNFERPFPDANLMAKVQSASMMPEIPNTMAFLLDIDIIAQSHLPVKSPEIKSKLDAMRGLKNHIFELCVTDKARESFR